MRVKWSYIQLNENWTQQQQVCIRKDKKRNREGQKERKEGKKEENAKRYYLN